MKIKLLGLASLACLATYATEEFPTTDGGQHTTSHLLTVLSITTDEGFTYDYSGLDSSPTVPTGLNNIVSYKYQSKNKDTGVLTTNTVNVSENYRTLEALVSSSDQVLQPVDQTNQTATHIDPYLSTSTEYLNAGNNGLSLSTGINKTPKYDHDTYQFALHGFNEGIVGDGLVDFFAADIAYNQSSEEISLYNAAGDMMAYLIIDKTDWDQQIGWQKLDRISLNKGPTENNINKEDFTAPISALAIEFSDFTLTNNFSWAQVASDAAMLEIDIPAIDDNQGGDNPPKTDYAFLFAVDTDQINATAIPEAQSIMYMLVILGSGTFIRRFFS